MFCVTRYKMDLYYRIFDGSICFNWWEAGGIRYLTLSGRALECRKATMLEF